jgi:hypothetical protein
MNNRRQAVCEGSSFNSFLNEEGILEQVEATYAETAKDESSARATEGRLQ